MITIEDIKYFTLTEVSQMFGKTTQTISNWRREGKLKAKKVSPKKFLFSEIALKNFIEGEEQDD